MNKTGFYVFCKPNQQPLSESEAKFLIHRLLSSEKGIDWEYDPQTMSPNAFIGRGLENATERISLSMHTVPHHHSRILMEYWKNETFVCSVTDLCYEPEMSELLRLFQQVASAVHKNPKPQIRYLHSASKA